jgi:hypothetical protein
MPAAMVTMLSSPGAAPGAEVYRNDFSRPDRLANNWSPARRDIAPNGGRLFLGRFGNETVTLSLSGLPKHRFVKISFDLYTMTTWAGNHKGAPSVWQLSVDGGPMLLDTSFSLWPDCEGYQQSYPVNRRLGEAPGYTGAAEKNTLGFKYDEQWGVRDAVYPISFTVVHSADAVQFNFAGVGVPGKVGDAIFGSWGLANVVVETLDERPVTKLKPAQLDDAWEALASPDAVKAHKAITALLGAEDQAVEFLARQMGEFPKPEAIKALLKQLDSDEFEVRQDATNKLTAMGSRARPLVKQALTDSKPSPEKSKRLEEILKNTAPGEAVDRREQHVRYILELIGTGAAREKLAELLPTPVKP